MENMDLRQVIKDCNLRFNEIAYEMGITPEHFSRLMSKELSLDDSNRIIDAINSLNAKRWREENANG